MLSGFRRLKPPITIQARLCTRRHGLRDCGVPTHPPLCGDNYLHPPHGIPACLWRQSPFRPSETPQHPTVPFVVLLLFSLVLARTKNVHDRMEYPTLANFVTSTLERSVNGMLGAGGNSGVGRADGASSSYSSAAATPESSFGCNVLTMYANRFREVRGGVDWVVIAEALGSGETGTATSSSGQAAPTPAGACALLRWVSWADELGAAPGPPGRAITADAAEAAADSALVLKSNARPYAEKALRMHSGDAGLAGAVAALEAATGRPDLAQRVLEAALRAHPQCSALWEQRVALEAAFGASSSRERAVATASAAASSGVLLRLRCVGYGGWSGLASRRLPTVPPLHPGARNTRNASRILAAVSNPSVRLATKSLSLQGAWEAPDKSAAAAAAPPSAEVPRSVFLLTNLVSLSLARNGLDAVPSAVGRLLFLRSLDVSNNALTVLPPSLARLSGSLRVLRVARNRLSSPLPALPLGALVNLRVLDLESNALAQFPEEVVLLLTELRTLKLAGNHFSSRAPASLSDALPHLEELTLP